MQNMRIEDTEKKSSSGGSESPQSQTLSNRLVQYREKNNDLQIKYNREKELNKHVIKSCCGYGGYVDIRCLELIVKVCISILTLAFCFFMLFMFPSDCTDNSAIYISIISVIISSWLNKGYEIVKEK